MILDWKKYTDKAVEAIAEGVVLLENKNGALPLDALKALAVFGRIQLDYYKSGTGSGGMVNVSKVTGITDGLLETAATLSERIMRQAEWPALVEAVGLFCASRLTVEGERVRITPE